jgi:hypothetical protein
VLAKKEGLFYKGRSLYQGESSKEVVLCRGASSVTVATDAGRDEKPSSARSPYPFRSSSQSSLLLRSPLHTPRHKGGVIVR